MNIFDAAKMMFCNRGAERSDVVKLLSYSLPVQYITAHQLFTTGEVVSVGITRPDTTLNQSSLYLFQSFLSGFINITRAS